MIVVSNALVIPDSPAGTPWIGYHNIVADDNIASTTEDADFPVSNLGNPATHLIWKGGVNTADEFITITINNDSPPLEFNYVAVAKHNWGSQGIPVTIEGLNLTDSPAGWHTLVQETTLTDDCPTIFRFVPEVLTSIRIKLAVGDSGIPPQAAVVYAGVLLILERSIKVDVDHTPINMGRRSKIINGMSESGNFLGRIVINTFNESAADFSWFNGDWYRTNFVPFIEAANEEPFFFAWHPITYPTEVGYVWMITDPIAAVDPITRRIAIQLRYRGITCE